jgi:hypothetical protein
VPGAVRRLVNDAGHVPPMKRPAEAQASIAETSARAGWGRAAQAGQDLAACCGLGGAITARSG